MISEDNWGEEPQEGAELMISEDNWDGGSLEA